MAKNNDRGVVFEEEIKQKIEGIFPESQFKVSISKGSGNQRHDGDVHVEHKLTRQKLIYTDCKNYESQAVPSQDQIEKAAKQGDRLGYLSSAVIMLNKDRKIIVSMRWEDYERLLQDAAIAERVSEVLPTKKLLSRI